MRNDPNLFDQNEGPPRIVLLAVGILALLFLGGGIYLFVSGPFTGIEVIAPADLPEVTTAVVDYQGTLWGLEKKRKSIQEALAELGLEGGQPITIFSKTPLLMRPINVHCRVGYLLPLGYAIRGLPEPIRIERLAPGRRLVVRVRGAGNFSGNKAYRAAEKALRPGGLRPAESERFEVKIYFQGRRYVEHWIPVR